MNFHHKLWGYLQKTGLHGDTILLFFIALLVRISLIAVLHPYRDLNRFELERTALSLASSGVYGNPYAIPTGPTAHVSPGYTLILAFLFHVFGTGVPAEIVKELLSCVVTSAGCALIPAAAVALSLTRRVGIIAAAVCALFPVKPLVQIDGDWEAPYASLFLVLLTIIVVPKWKKRNVSIRTACLLGWVWGLSILFSSVLLPLYGVTLLAGFYILRSLPLRRAFLFTATELGITCLVLLPWIVRNQTALGSPIATRSNFGIELRVSNNNEATADQRVNSLRGVYDRYHPLQSANEALKVKQMGEVAYNRMVLAQTKIWITSHQGRFFQLCMKRLLAFWFYPDPSKVKAGFGFLTALFGLAGFYFVLRQNRDAGIFLGIIFLLYPAPSYLIHVGARQRYPIDWLLTLLSVFAILYVWELIRRSQSTPAELASTLQPAS